MTLPLLHRRLATGAALAALMTFAAGVGIASLYVLVAGSVLVTALVWRPSAAVAQRLERLAHTGAWVLFAWLFYVGFVLRGDVLHASLSLLLFLLASETLRPLEARNDMRLYGLSFALLIAGTAYYPGVGFALGFVAYIVLTTLALMVGHLRRQAETFRIANLRVGRPLLTATAALSGVTVLMSGLVFVTFPRIPRNWSGPNLRGGDAQMAGFSDQVSIGEFGSRIADNPEVVFRVEFPDGVPDNPAGLHWRGRSYDRFDGVRWSRSRGAAAAVPPELYWARWGQTTIRQQIFGGPGGAPVLFGLHPILDVRERPGMRSFQDLTGDIRFWGTNDPVYTVFSGARRPPEAALRAAGDGVPPAGGAYLQLPDLDPRIPALADSLTSGLSTRYARVLAVEQYFKREFSYTLDLPLRQDQASLGFFLFERRAGHCEYFSTAMVVLLRSVGIPARNVNGFLGGTWNTEGRYLAVTQNDAHSWVEVWFPDLGWVPFDPTPSGSRAASVGTQEGRTSLLQSTRAFFDALSHRWNKWVLNYNIQRQWEVFQGIGNLFRRTPDLRSPEGLGGALRGLLPWLAAAVALFLALRRLPRRRAPAREETRLYLDLRRAYTRAGWGPENAPPLAWVDSLHRAGHPGAPAAERLVRAYLRARFGDQPIGELERAGMRADLEEARRLLRSGRKAA